MNIRSILSLAKLLHTVTKSMPCVSSLPLQISNSLFDNQFLMADFTATGDGDLQAVVRGCTNCFSTNSIMVDNPPPPCFSPPIIQEDHDFVFTTFPDLFETTTVLDELEELYKPFYPISNPLSPQTVLSSSISVSGEEREAEKVQEKEASSGSPAVVAAATSTALAAKYKRRKTQHKRVVLQVTAEDLSSDTWAWRKYGQKPIKGSPYPRSYYRCSSSKGCLARKQVERSHSDPEMFVITYTAEHCHSRPTRRSSLAGTTRHRFSIPKSAASTGDSDAPISTGSGGSPISPAALSPPNPLLAATKEDEFSEQVIKEEEEEEQPVDYRSERNGLALCDMILSDDDFLGGFDEIHRLTSDLAYKGALRGKFPMSFPC